MLVGGSKNIYSDSNTTSLPLIQFHSHFCRTAFRKQDLARTRSLQQRRCSSKAVSPSSQNKQKKKNEKIYLAEIAIFLLLRLLLRPVTAPTILYSYSTRSFNYQCYFWINDLLEDGWKTFCNLRGFRDKKPCTRYVFQIFLLLI